MSSSLINWDNSHDSADFTNTIVPSAVNPRILLQPLNSIQAVRGKINGGSRKNSEKKCSIMYKRKMQKMRSTKKRKGGKVKGKRRNVRVTKRATGKKRNRNTKKRGGYSQYQNNLPLTQVYQTAVPLDPSDSALANPVPYKVLSNCTNCVDNYDLYSNSGFPSKGWY